MKFRRRITKSIIFFCVVLMCALLIKAIVPVGESKAKLSEIFLARPIFAQQATAFPSDEAGISAYVNVGQTIDLAKAKNAMRGTQAEGSNYVIGIMELPGLPEEEFPHVYVSSDGWILAYYSKFAPAARVMQWYGYEGGTISTTTLQDAIAKICPPIGVNFAQVRGNMGYYHLKYSEATKMVIAVERIGEGDTSKTDTFNFSIPHDVTLYEGSWSHTGRTRYYSDVKVDGTRVSKIGYTGFISDYFEDQQIAPGKLHTIELYTSHYESPNWAGVAAVFIYR